MTAEPVHPGPPVPELADSEARRSIREQLDGTLFVQASAGTGKTASLVDRVVNLVATGKATMDRIAAITFTESAAAELRDRIRQQLELAGGAESPGEPERQRCLQGMFDLDQAAICTLHAFAALILHERPLEAGLPPAFETSDEIVAGIRFNEAWDAWLDVALEDDSPLFYPLSVALTLGMTPDHLKNIGRQFHRNYTDLENVRFSQADSRTEHAADLLVENLPELQRLCEFSRLGPEDSLFAHVQRKLAPLRRLSEAEPGTPAAYRLMARMLPLRCRVGRQSDWDTDPSTGANACAALKALLTEMDSAANADIAQARHVSLLPVLEAVRRFVLDYAEARRAEGRAEFHDLLAWARVLLRDNIEVRDHFRRRFSHLLIDEAQDTDPIQAEIAMFLAEYVPPEATPESRPRSWEQISPEKGKLFVVGDPKQSIYRFRRADVVQMLQLQERMESAGGSTASLTQNFRSEESIIHWVNHVFAQWMPESREESENAGQLQAQYEIMFAQRSGSSRGAYHPQVWALGNETVEGTVESVRRDESRDIAQLLRQMTTQGWQTLNREETDESGGETYRPIRLSDICILMPRRTGLQILERGLEALDIPYRLESASLIFETQEIRDLLNCLRSLDDPANTVATVAALRSPAFGCSDVDLLRHRESGGAFEYTREPAGSFPGPVGEALEVLREFHERRNSGSLGYLVDEFVRYRLLMEVAVDHPRMREQWRRYRFMVERSWQFAAAGGNSLRSFVEWMEEQISERARVTESPVPESDEDAVRIMTVHAAKGLEFPVVVLTGINSSSNFRNETTYFDRSGGRVEVGVGGQASRFATDGYEELSNVEREISGAESVRLMYVAATRARDHLVLSMRRTESSRGSSSPAGQIDEFMQDAPDLWSDVEPLVARSVAEDHPGDDHISPTTDPPAEHLVHAMEEWEKARQSLMEELGRPSSIAATSLGRTGPGETEEKPEQEREEPWRRGRAGTAVGRAVHAVLQVIDLDTGEGIADRARAQAMAEGVPRREEEIARLARVAVDSRIVRRAVGSGRFWREVPVAVGTAGGSLHGFIDLLFEEEDGLVVVDYKTDSVDAAETAESVSRYRLQGGAYAHAIQQTTGRPVKEVVFLYLQRNIEEPLTGLTQAMREAQANAEAALSARPG